MPMSRQKGAVFIACFALLAAQAADARPITRYRYYVPKPITVGCPVHRAVDGTPVDCHGWRYRDNYGWDNTCFNLDYMPTMYACSAHGAR